MEKPTQSVADALEQNLAWLESLGCQGYDSSPEPAPGLAQLFVLPAMTDETRTEIRQRLAPFLIEFVETSGTICAE